MSNYHIYDDDGDYVGTVKGEPEWNYGCLGTLGGTALGFLLVVAVVVLIAYLGVGIWSTPSAWFFLPPLVVPIIKMSRIIKSKEAESFSSIFRKLSRSTLISLSIYAFFLAVIEAITTGRFLVTFLGAIVAVFVISIAPITIFTLITLIIKRIQTRLRR